MHVSLPSFMFPYVCRNIAKQTFLETLQDNLIEMDILTSSRHDGAYNDGYVWRLMWSILPLFTCGVLLSLILAWELIGHIIAVFFLFFTYLSCTSRPLAFRPPPDKSVADKTMRFFEGPVHINGSLVNMLIHGISLAPFVTPRKSFH